MTKHISLFVLFVMASALTNASLADDSWSLSKLNPFKKKETSVAKRARASFSDEMPQKSRFPKLTMPKWPTRSHTPAPAPPRLDEPSTLSKLNQGTKDLYGKTKSVLMPWTNKPKAKPTYRGTSSKKSSSILTSWLPKKKEEKPRPKTVKDFIGQPRPGF